jgi:hypothetical protein
MTKEDFRKRYSDAALRYTALLVKEERRVLIVSVLRLLLFLGGIFFIWLGFTMNVYAGFALTIILIGLFFWLLRLFSQFSRKKDFFSNMVKINQNEADALAGDLSAFKTGNSYVDIRHDFSFDVDLFGESSLFQYLNRTVTGFGRDILAGWLSDPFSIKDLIAERQKTIQELASKDVWRQEFMASGMVTPLERDDIEDILIWMGEKEIINSSSLKKILLTGLPAVALVLLLLWIAGIISSTLFITVTIVNLAYVATGLRKTNSIHKVLSRKYNFLSSMSSLLKTFENESFNSPALNKIKLGFTGKEISASVAVKKLGRLIQSFDSRNNMMVGFALNGMLLWDYQCVSRLEKWKSEYRNFFPYWLSMIGEVDAFNSLSNYAYNNPGFVYPVLSGDQNVFSAKDLGHQLIDEEKRVCNDFSLGKHGTVCIITGANMAGKSTFLRTVAVNLILGMTGAPVCASELKFKPARIFTSMRTVDSLTDNESYFYAEVRRLSLLKSRIEKGEPLFFILDEILKGTNSEDKSTGSKLFLRRIIENTGTGLIATHDTSLAKLEAEYNCVKNKCFEIEIEGESIRFDYKIQDGITSKMNAVLLMKQMGILD